MDVVQLSGHRPGENKGRNGVRWCSSTMRIPVVDIICVVLGLAAQWQCASGVPDRIVAFGGALTADERGGVPAAVKYQQVCDQILTEAEELRPWQARRIMPSF